MDCITLWSYSVTGIVQSSDPSLVIKFVFCWINKNSFKCIKTISCCPLQHLSFSNKINCFKARWFSIFKSFSSYQVLNMSGDFSLDVDLLLTIFFILITIVFSTGFCHEMAGILPMWCYAMIHSCIHSYILTLDIPQIISLWNFHWIQQSATLMTYSQIALIST